MMLSRSESLREREALEAIQRVTRATLLCGIATRAAPARDDFVIRCMENP
jgi:hypothetical protein